MKEKTQTLTEKADALLPDALKDFQAEGMCDAVDNFFSKQSLKPNLTDFVNNAQKQAYVKGYTTSLRLQVLRIMEAVEKLEAVWHYDAEVQTNQEEEK